jgi:outer membrane immunogenic protein
MKRAFALLAGVAAVVGLGYGASAADLAVSAAPAPVAAPTWTGFYIGVHGGAAMASPSNWSFNDPSGFFLPVTFGQSGAATGAVGGLQVGYNWQFAPTWVAGVEGDFSWASLADHRTSAPVIGGGVLLAGSSLSMSANTQWLSSVRGKLGFTGWFNNTMLYVTGGGAAANIEYVAQLIPGVTALSVNSFNSIRSGWVVGGGAEWMATTNILLRAEYLYYGISAGLSADSPGLPPTAPRRFNYSWSREDIQVFRVAGSYKF